MASKRRIRRNKCGGKRRHETKEAALSDVFSMRRHGVGGETVSHRLQVYRCSFCSGFHVGHGGKRVGGKR